jgi:hypothetical protein
MSVAVGVIGTGVMGAEHARLVRRETPGAHLAGISRASSTPTPPVRKRLQRARLSFLALDL